MSNYKRLDKESPLGRDVQVWVKLSTTQIAQLKSLDKDKSAGDLVTKLVTNYLEVRFPPPKEEEK